MIDHFYSICWCFFSSSLLILVLCLLLIHHSATLLFLLDQTQRIQQIQSSLFRNSNYFVNLFSSTSGKQKSQVFRRSFPAGLVFHISVKRTTNKLHSHKFTRHQSIKNPGGRACNLQEKVSSSSVLLKNNSFIIELINYNDQQWEREKELQ
mgnify:CR=1 FL=1